MTLIATYSKWGNLFLGRFYVNGVRVKESKFDAELDDLVKCGNFKRSLDNVSPTKYRLIWKG